jgi:hypothetical protein
MLSNEREFLGVGRAERKAEVVLMVQQWREALNRSCENGGSTLRLLTGDSKQKLRRRGLSGHQRQLDDRDQTALGALPELCIPAASRRDRLHNGEAQAVTSGLFRNGC